VNERHAYCIIHVCLRRTQISTINQCIFQDGSLQRIRRDVLVVVVVIIIIICENTGHSCALMITILFLIQFRTLDTTVCSKVTVNARSVTFKTKGLWILRRYLVDAHKWTTQFKHTGQKLHLYSDRIPARCIRCVFSVFISWLQCAAAAIANAWQVCWRLDFGTLND